MHAFVLHLFSLFEALDVQVLSFDGVAELLHIFLQLLSKNFVYSLILLCPQGLKFCLPLITVCCSGFQLHFLFDLRSFLFLGFLFVYPYLYHTPLP
jgi:hypothetical protein